MSRRIGSDGDSRRVHNMPKRIVTITNDGLPSGQEAVAGSLAASLKTYGAAMAAGFAYRPDKSLDGGVIVFKWLWWTFAVGLKREEGGSITASAVRLTRRAIKEAQG